MAGDMRADELIRAKLNQMKGVADHGGFALLTLGSFRHGGDPIGN